MTQSFSDLINNQARQAARDTFFTHTATLDYHGQDLYSTGQTLLFTAAEIISPMQGGLKAEMNQGSEAFIQHLREKQYHVRDMIDFLNKRLHLTAYVKDNDPMLMRLVKQFDDTLPQDETDLKLPLKRSDLAGVHLKLAKQVAAQHDNDYTAIAKGMQDVAIACLALSGMSQRHFSVSLRIQMRHLHKLYRSIAQCRHGFEDMVGEQKKMAKRLGS